MTPDIDPVKYQAFIMRTPVERQFMLFQGIEEVGEKVDTLADEMKCIRRKVIRNTIKIYGVASGIVIAGVIIGLATYFGG